MIKIPLKARWARRLVRVLAVVFVLYGLGRLLVEPLALRWVNQRLDAIEGYHGSLQDLDLNILRGRVTFDSLILEIDSGGFTRPFVNLPAGEAHVQLGALFRGRLVSEVYLDNPELTVEISPTTSSSNLVESVDWVQVIRDLGVIQVNRFETRNARFTFVDNSVSPPIELWADSIGVEATNLATVYNTDQALPSEISLQGVTVGQGDFAMHGSMYLLRSVPNMDLELSYEQGSLTEFNPAFREYARLDLESGNLACYAEWAVRNDTIAGYVKPLFEQVRVVDWQEKPEGALQAMWEGVVGLFALPLHNRKSDRIAARIPISGTVSDVDQGILPALGSLLLNAFIRPLRPEVDQSVSLDDV